MSKETLKAHHAAVDSIRSTVSVMLSLARAFNRTGNEEVSMELRDICGDLTAAADMAEKAYGDFLNEGFIHASAISSSLLACALHGLTPGTVTEQCATADEGEIEFGK